MIQQLVYIDVSVRQIEARNLCADDADGVFSNWLAVWVANILENQAMRCSPQLPLANRSSELSPS